MFTAPLSVSYAEKFLESMCEQSSLMVEIGHITDFDRVIALQNFFHKKNIFFQRNDIYVLIKHTILYVRTCNRRSRCIPSVELVLLRHGDVPIGFHRVTRTYVYIKDRLAG